MKSDFERTFSNFSNFMASVSRPTSVASPSQSSSSDRHFHHPQHDDPMGRIYEGQLYKFTNVVKGWQYRLQFFRLQISVTLAVKNLKTCKYYLVDIVFMQTQQVG